MTIRSMKDTNKFHFFFVFRSSVLFIITVYFTMVIKKSPGRESAGDGQLTPKSTCVVTVLEL